MPFRFSIVTTLFLINIKIPSVSFHIETQKHSATIFLSTYGFISMFFPSKNRISVRRKVNMINFAYKLQKIRFIYRIKASGLFSFEKFSSMLNFTHNINNLDHQCGTLIRKRRLIEKFSNSSQ